MEISSSSCKCGNGCITQSRRGRRVKYIIFIQLFICGSGELIERAWDDIFFGFWTLDFVFNPFEI
jgi:hypothetical protein